MNAEGRATLKYPDMELWKDNITYSVRVGADCEWSISLTVPFHCQPQRERKFVNKWVTVVLLLFENVLYIPVDIDAGRIAQSHKDVRA